MLRSLGDFMLTPRRIALLLAVALGLVAFVAFRDQLNLAYLHAHALALDPAMVLLALFALPLLGFPVSVMHAVTGAKFGLPLGMTLVGLSIAFQLFASYGIVRLAPNFFANRFAWLRERLPPTTHRDLILFTLLLPGAPYFAQNYTLALVRVPFWQFFRYAFPIAFVRSLIGVIFGEWSGHMTPGRIAFFVLYTAAIMLICGLAFRRLRAQLRNQRRAGSGRRRSARSGHAGR
jgi:uncharacterized membrane protein YdjX (TVP38/TMEM64 family)